MLAREFRLRRAPEFQLAMRGRRAGRRTVVVHLSLGDLPAPDVDVAPVADPGGSTSPRVGFIVSRAVGGATTRNRVRRRMRHVIAARLADLPPGSLLVLRALPPAATAPSVTLEADIDAALGRVLAAPGRHR